MASSVFSSCWISNFSSSHRIITLQDVMMPYLSIMKKCVHQCHKDKYSCRMQWKCFLPKTVGSSRLLKSFMFILKRGTVGHLLFVNWPSQIILVEQSKQHPIAPFLIYLLKSASCKLGVNFTCAVTLLHCCKFCPTDSRKDLGWQVQNDLPELILLKRGESGLKDLTLPLFS